VGIGQNHREKVTSMPKLLIATENKGKRRELQELLADLSGIELVPSNWVR
jgi:hypothetical protein